VVVDEAPSSLVLDGEGRFLHEGTLVTHARLLALLHRSIARLDDGSYVVTTGRDRVALVVVDTPYFVRTLVRHDDAVCLVLSDDTREEIDGATALVVDGADRLLARVKGGRFWARLLRPAHAAVVDAIPDDAAISDDDGPDQGAFVSHPLGAHVTVRRAPRGLDPRA